MNDEIVVKKYNDDIAKELENVNFSRDYLNTAMSKFAPVQLKIIGLKPVEANILKQTCLSLGFDAAVNRDAVICKCDSSDALIFASKSQIEKLIPKLKIQPFRLKKLAFHLENFINVQKSYYLSGHEFAFDKTYIMGILNVTPDSFSDGGKNYSHDIAIQNALKMLEDGADIIDIGGESTRPSAIPVSYQTECERIIPVVRGIKKSAPDAIISVDTIHPETIVKAVEAGADILNNVDCVEKFQSVFDFLKARKIPIVITHSHSIPPLPVENDFDGDIVECIFKFFYEKIQYLKSNGLSDNLFILDPGIGFGKSINDQFEIIKRADEFLSLGSPVLFGISRKSFIFKTFGLENRDEITKIYSQYLASKKVNIIRVHDVKSHAELLKYLKPLV